jgi:hypothetical protein
MKLRGLTPATLGLVAGSLQLAWKRLPLEYVLRSANSLM